jgi:hypothetical protein
LSDSDDRGRRFKYSNELDPHNRLSRIDRRKVALNNVVVLVTVASGGS